jgi:hypothetical protein
VSVVRERKLDSISGWIGGEQPHLSDDRNPLFRVSDTGTIERAPGFVQM